MKVETFIRRPILATGFTILLVLLGVIGLVTMPVEQFPELAPPTVRVTTQYPGANAEVVQRTVVAPLEESINGAENMLYMTSTSSGYGNVTINVFFRAGTNPDMAVVDVQNRVASASARLPEEVNHIGITTRKQQTSELMSFVLTSPDGRFDRSFLVNYLKINVQPAILRIAGVGDVFAMGQDYGMRIWLDPAKMAQYKLMPSDVTRILEQQNIEVSMGDFGAESTNTYQYALKYTGRLITEEEFGNMVVRALPNGQVLRMRDIAKVELGEQNYLFFAEMQGKPALLCQVYQTPGSNASEVTAAVEQYLNEVQKTFPKGMEVKIIQNRNEFLYASINNVVHTLVEAIVLVVLVVLFFLQKIRITLIPTLSILVSLVGTFAFLSIAGFSINLLTLFALVLVIGTVVDDSIVVVEAVQTEFENGCRSPYQATVKGMRNITNAIVTSSLVFMSVFIPVCFISGSQGTFYRQFGVTMAIAVAISAVNSLTFCPAMCAMFMRHDTAEKGLTKILSKAYNASFNAMLGKYKKALSVFIRHRWITAGSLVCATALLTALISTTPSGFIPSEDTGILYQNVAMRPGSSLDNTHSMQLRINEELEKIPQIESVTQISGNGIISGQGASYGYTLIRLKPWSERKGSENSMDAVIEEINKRMAKFKDAQVLTFAPPMISGYGTSNALEMHLQDRTGGDINRFYQVSQDFIAALSARPEIASAYSAFSPSFPMFRVDVDAALCEQFGTNVYDVLNVIGGYCGGVYASDFNRFGKMYRVMVQASPEYRLDEQSLNNMFVRCGEGESATMAPVGQFVSLTPIKSPLSLYRFNLFNSIQVSVTPADGYSTGDAISAIDEMAQGTLPNNFSYEFGGMTREESQQTGSIYIIFALCVVFIYLLLIMLYESFLIPFAVLLSVPFGLAGSFLFARIAGLDNNIYMQTGLIMLIGLMTKTAILLTEYATELRRSGMSLSQAAFTAAKIRLRPILMTSLAMIVGMLPMMFSSGVGANGNRSLGTTVVGGLVVGIVALLVVVPPMFIVFQRLQERFRRPQYIEENVEA
ncbi:MAG: efflux RND transporter permease subunit [Prevotellaceae bacterium]|nr:efflux RND transporter permease subunit [Prevotellaceae bacterium]